MGTIASSLGSAHSLLLTPGALWAGVCVWAGLEVAFYFLLAYVIHPRLEPPRQAPQGPLPPRECLARLVDTLERLKGMYPAERFWSGWFRGAPFADIHRENVKEFLCWAVWHVEAWELAESPEEAAALEEGVQALERAQGRPFPPGHNPRVSHVAFTREPLRFSHRLLAYYVLVKLGQLVGHTLLRLRGHRRHATRSGLTYWHRTCQQPGPVKQLPLVFCHGISPGLWFYQAFLARLAKGRAVVLLEVPHIVTQLAFDAPDVERVVAALGEIFARHCIQECAVAGHSFGSIVAGWAAAAFPERVQQLILIDPVCLLLCLPDVAVNFLYRSPSANVFARSVKDLIDPSSELTVAHALRRHFWWYQKVVWLQDLKRCHVVVALSSEDDIVPSPAIRHYVARHYGLPDHHDAAAAALARHAPHGQDRERERGVSSSLSSSLPSLSSGLSWGRRRGRWAGSAWAVLRNPRRGRRAWRTLFHRPSQAAAREKAGLPDARLIYWEGLGHGAMLFSLEAQHRLIDAVDGQALARGLVRWAKPEAEAAAEAAVDAAAAAAPPLAAVQDQQQHRSEASSEPFAPKPATADAAAAAAAATAAPLTPLSPSKIRSSISGISSRIKRRLPASPFPRRRPVMAA